MKKYLLVAVVTALVSFFSNSEVSAQSQNNLINNTGCDVVVAYQWGIDGNCQTMGYDLVVVPAKSSIPANVPEEAWIIMAKGNYANTTGGCNPFYVGLPPCTNYPAVHVETCASNCGNIIKGEIDPSFGVMISSTP